MAVQYRYNSLVDGTGPPMYKYVIPYTTYHLNTSHSYHFVIYIYSSYRYIYHFFFCDVEGLVCTIHTYLRYSFIASFHAFSIFWISSLQYCISYCYCSKSRVEFCLNIKTKKYLPNWNKFQFFRHIEFLIKLNNIDSFRFMLKL